MPGLYSRRWTQPFFPKRDGLQDDFTRLRCGGRPVVLTQQKNTFREFIPCGTFHPINRGEIFIQSWQPANPACYERYLKCPICGGGFKDILRIPPKPYRYRSLNDDQEDDEEGMKLSDNLMDSMYISWLNDDNLVETKVPEIGPPLPSKQHHMKHHKFKRLVRPEEKFSRICCSECDYPYHLYKRRKPPHLYTPIKINLPIRHKEPIAVLQSHRTISIPSKIDINATSEERLKWAINNQQFDEARRISTDMFASIVDDHLLRMHRLN